MPKATVAQGPSNRHDPPAAVPPLVELEPVDAGPEPEPEPEAQTEADPVTEPEPGPERPRIYGTKADWVSYAEASDPGAVHRGGRPAGELTKAELASIYGAR